MHGRRKREGDLRNLFATQSREQNRKVAAEEFHFRDADDLPSGSELLTKSDSELVFSVDMV